MKIYFEDGLLKWDDYSKFIDDYDYVVRVNAMEGPNMCIKFLDHFKGKYPDCTIYTNSIFAFSNKYAWNSRLKIPEIYIRDENDEWTRIDELTNRELKQGHNLAKMYIAGEFYRREEIRNDQISN